MMIHDYENVWPSDLKIASKLEIFWGCTSAKHIASISDQVLNFYAIVLGASKWFLEKLCHKVYVTWHAIYVPKSMLNSRMKTVLYAGSFLNDVQSLQKRRPFWLALLSYQKPSECQRLQVWCLTVTVRIIRERLEFRGRLKRELAELIIQEFRLILVLRSPLYILVI